MSVKIYPITGITGPQKSVSLWHTNRHLKNFHWSLDQDIQKVYDSWPEGEYTFVAGYQNGYCELGIAHVIVKFMEP